MCHEILLFFPLEHKRSGLQLFIVAGDPRALYCNSVELCVPIPTLHVRPMILLACFLPEVLLKGKRVLSPN